MSGSYNEVSSGRILPEFRRNVGKILPNYIVSHPSRYYSSKDDIMG
jgi:hypothetical protein